MATIPMHFWCPDVYEGAPTCITAFLSVTSKAAGFALTIRFLDALRIVDANLANRVNWPVIMIVISLFTMTLGNLAALWQDNLKRMFAYSSIAHAGYMLMGTVVLRGGQYPGAGLIAYYLLAYLAMNLGAFAVVILMENRLGSVDISAYSGLGRRAPFLAIALTIFLFSLIGIPPTAGFGGKYLLFQGVLEAGKNGGGWPYYFLAVAAVLNTAISVYYYARIIKNMYLLAEPTPATAGASAAGANGRSLLEGDPGRLNFPILGTALVAVFLFLTFYLFFLLGDVSKFTFNLKIFS
jgi:NADH-quinone oxidoreductase subunit N